MKESRGGDKDHKKGHHPTKGSVARTHLIPVGMALRASACPHPPDPTFYRDQS